MADFTITAPVPFIVEGVSGKTYELPRLRDLSAEQVADMGALAESKDAADRLRRTKAFVLSLCPELADEPMPDMQYTQLFVALADGMDVGLGES